MKSLVLLRSIIFLMLAIKASEASLLPIGRSRTKKLHDRKTIDSPYICLDPPIELPSCNFKIEDNEEIDKLSGQKGSFEHFGSSDRFIDSDQLSSRDNIEQGYAGALTIVYKIEGCIPSRLPFVLPICETEDSIGRIIEVRRLFPFKVMGNSKNDPGVPLVFPELDINEWHRFIKGPWTHQAKNEDEIEKTISKDPERSSTLEKLPKRKKFNHDDANEKRKFHEKLAILRVTKNIGGNDVYPKISTSSLSTKYGLTKDRERETNPYKILSKNRLYDEDKRSNEKIDKDTNDKISLNYLEEFPYEKAISYDEEKLLSGSLSRKFPYRSIPYDEKKFEVSKLSREFSHAGGISHEPKNLRVIDLGSEFPYRRAIPYDPEKLRTARLGSEFPYSRAIPYDPKKLQKRKNETIERSLRYYTRRLKVVEKTRDEEFSDDVPFDKSMLEAAKDDGIFPYVKGIPEDTSKKNLENLKFPISRETEMIKVPVRRIDRITTNRSKILSDVPRLTRDVSEPSTSDVSSVSYDHEVPSPWSEFPYSKAIPFDPSKLRRSRSTNNRGNSLITIPYVFPYARAIPYDSWKLKNLRRNNAETIGELTNLDEFETP